MRNQKQITERWSKIGLLEEIENKDYLANYYEELMEITTEYSRRRRGEIEQVETTIFPMAYRIFFKLKKIPFSPMNFFNNVKNFLNSNKNKEMFNEMAMVIGYPDAETEMVALYCNAIIEKENNKNK